jgi:ribosomal protein L40E
VFIETIPTNKIQNTHKGGTVMGKITIENRNTQTENFPHNCMICVDRNTTKSINTNYYFYPYWTYLGLLLGAIPFIVLAMIFKKEQRVNVQLCEECHARWKMLPTFGALVGFVEFIIFIAMIALFVNEQIALGFATLALLIILPIVYIIGHNNKYAISCQKINDYAITLSVPNDRYPQIYQDYIMTNPVGYASVPSINVQAPCRHCGNVNMPGARFCEKCGQTV